MNNFIKEFSYLNVYYLSAIIFLVIVAAITFIVLKRRSKKKLEEEPKVRPEVKLEIKPEVKVEFKEVKKEEVTKEVIEEKKEEIVKEVAVEIVEEVVPEVIEEKKAPWSQRLKNGLVRSRGEVWDKVGELFSRGKMDNAVLDEMEEILYAADLGPKLVEELIAELKKSASANTTNNFKLILYDFLYKRMEMYQQNNHNQKELAPSQKNTNVIMIVGVNGVGKTTTIGKLAMRYASNGAKVVVGACDTFRAAAVDQLEIWCKRANVQMIRAKEGSDPSGVAYETLQTARNTGADYCILDTAGRLHNNMNLMEELKKLKRVLTKLDPMAPHQILLVLDAITGQNAIKQAQEFHKALNLTGIIFTKCDGSSKAGSAVAIIQELKVPIIFIGVGESVEDLDRFELKEYLQALLNI
ncbi:MAG: signal recognition particle-docking protein FtsY [Oligoflexia bacterium]|nr:signal recognition particle-docking protein FtsY [Oligoflexia bacterium]